MHAEVHARAPEARRTRTASSVVVGAEVEALDPILDLITGAEDDHGYSPAVASELPEHLEPVHVGEAEVGEQVEFGIPAANERLRARRHESTR